MNLIYKGRYSGRFKQITAHITGKKVTELCFGDTVIAEFCRIKGIQWKGIDINESFVKTALKRGYNAQLENIETLDHFPTADTCILSGSMYHFHESTEELFRKMLACAPMLIISEPMINLSNNKGIIGNLAKASASINGKKQVFRYTMDSLTAEMNLLSNKLNFNFRIVKQFDKDLIIVINR